MNKKFDNIVHTFWEDGTEYWAGYNDEGNRFKCLIKNGERWYSKFDKKMNIIDEMSENEFLLLEKEIDWIEFRKKEKEYNSRTKCSRFEIMEI